MPRRARGARRILVIDGHPDEDRGHFVHGLAGAYREAALAAGHELRTIGIARLEFPLLRSPADFQKGSPPRSIAAAQNDIAWAEHLAIFYPLWLGSMPALTKAFFEQCLRPGFAFGPATGRGLPKQKLKGRSARVVVTMGMPTFFYRWFYRAHSLKSFERNILHFCGIRPVRASVVGMVESRAARERALAAMRRFGAKAL
jgi:putative NADPH-quinone reductase